MTTALLISTSTGPWAWMRAKAVATEASSVTSMIGDLPGGDCRLGHACYIARRLDCLTEDMPHLHAHVKRLEARPAFENGIKT